mmetsp:Transcript_4414/g.12733  ORF Transcript_4414/g.12733 Transcript_4414/m.12733 type:complete len:329 (+) Transcript_4414:1371-2357(+)
MHRRADSPLPCGAHGTSHADPARPLRAVPRFRSVHRQSCLLWRQDVLLRVGRAAVHVHGRRRRADGGRVLPLQCEDHPVATQVHPGAQSPKAAGGGAGAGAGHRHRVVPGLLCSPLPRPAPPRRPDVPGGERGQERGVLRRRRGGPPPGALPLPLVPQRFLLHWRPAVLPATQPESAHGHALRGTPPSGPPRLLLPLRRAVFVLRADVPIYDLDQRRGGIHWNVCPSSGNRGNGRSHLWAPRHCHCQVGGQRAAGQSNSVQCGGGGGVHGGRHPYDPHHHRDGNGNDRSLAADCANHAHRVRVQDCWGPLRSGHRRHAHQAARRAGAG